MRRSKQPYIGLNHPIEDQHEDLLSGLLPSQGLGFLVGEPGVCKSFLALRLCASLATQAPFIDDSHSLKTNNPSLGCPTDFYMSLYIAGERENGLPSRQRAIIDAFGLTYGLYHLSSGLSVITYPMRGQDYNTLIHDVPALTKDARSQLEGLDYKTGLIIVDTLQSALNTPNENDNSAMQYNMNCLRALADELGCFVMIITHPAHAYGKNGAYSIKGVPRGATSMRGTADIIWCMEKVNKDGLHKLTVTKGSEGYCEGHSFFFNLEPYGKSAALMPAQAPPEKTHSNAEANGTKLSNNDLGVLKAMNYCNNSLPDQTDDRGITRSTLHITLKQLHSKAAIGAETKAISDSGIGNRITKAIDRLKEAGLISTYQSDNETLYKTVKPWPEMENFTKIKYPSVNFDSITFL